MKNFFKKKTFAEFHDSGLGVLVLDGGIWCGKVQHDGRELRFGIAGTERAPDSRLLERVSSLLAGFAGTERSAADFLRSRESELRQARLDFYSFDFLWEDRLDDFAFEFLADGDDSQVWRVEFVGGQPQATGCDD